MPALTAPYSTVLWLLLLTVTIGCQGRSQAPIAQSPLNDTGITRCLSDQGVTGCEDPNSWPGQDGHFGRDLHTGFDWQRLDSAGKPLAQDTPLFSSGSRLTWRCLQDQVTGLIWQLDPEQPTLPFADTTQVLQQARREAWCGQTDWRLPTQTEWLGVLDLSQSLPPLQTGWFGPTALNAYWTASRANATQQWYVYLSGGNNGRVDHTQLAHLRLVSDGQNTLASDDCAESPSLARLSKTQSGDWFDATTGLTWQNCPVGFQRESGLCTAPESALMNWRQALEAAATQGPSWRMPNLKELASLLASGCGEGIFAEALGIPATFAPIWSSSPIVYFDQPSAWWLNSRQGEWQAASIQARAAVWLVK